MPRSPNKLSEKQRFQRWMSIEGLKGLNIKTPFSLFSNREMKERLKIRRK